MLIKNVPADGCKNCGHYYLSAEMTALVLEMEKDAYDKGTELEVLKLEVV